MKFDRDRRSWLRWLFQARKRFGISILNYTVTSNHIHLIIREGCEPGMIPQTMQLIAGRTAQEYNNRKKRKGAFWEDRYHATVIESGSHLAHCMVYIDLNMVRAGIVAHPSEWPFSGYNEIVNPRRRYGLIDHEGLMEALDVRTISALKNSYGGSASASLRTGGGAFHPKWTRSIAVGSETFVEQVKAELGSRALGRRVAAEDGTFELRETDVSYNHNFAGENGALRPENTYLWRGYD